MANRMRVRSMNGVTPRGKAGAALPRESHPTCESGGSSSKRTPRVASASRSRAGASVRIGSPGGRRCAAERRRPSRGPTRSRDRTRRGVSTSKGASPWGPACRSALPSAARSLPLGRIERRTGPRSRRRSVPPEGVSPIRRTNRRRCSGSAKDGTRHDDDGGSNEGDPREDEHGFVSRRSGGRPEAARSATKSRPTTPIPTFRRRRRAGRVPRAPP